MLLLFSSLLRYNKIKRRRRQELPSPSLLHYNKTKKEGIREGAYFKLPLWVSRGSRFRRSGTPSSSVLASSFKRVNSTPTCAPTAPKLQRWSECKINQEVGGGRQVGGREKFWGQKKVEKNNNFEQGGCVFSSSPKQLEPPHPQLVHWWLLVHFSP